MADDTHNLNNVVKIQNGIDERILALMERHRDLDDSIMALERAGTFTQLQVQRLKKQKLLLRDEIARLRSLGLPDIIA